MRSSLEKELGGCEGRRYCGQEAMCVSLMCPSFEVWSPVSPFTASFLVPPRLSQAASRNHNIQYQYVYIYIYSILFWLRSQEILLQGLRSIWWPPFFCIRNRTTCLAVSWPISSDPKGTLYHRPNISGFNARCTCRLLPSALAAAVVWLAPSSFAAF